MATPLAAADLKVPPIYGKAPPVELLLWSGPYVGANIGYGWGDWDSAGSWANYAVTTAPAVSGAFGGIQGGYNWQFNQLVLGVEADVQLSGISGSSDIVSIPGHAAICQTVTTKCGGTKQSCTQAAASSTVSGEWDMNWFSTIRGRAGVTIDRWLAYGTAGFAFADIDYGGDSKTKAGYVVGAGLETSVAHNWTVKAEYLFMDLGSETFGSGRNTITSDIQEHVVRIGANYHFNPHSLFLANR